MLAAAIITAGATVALAMLAYLQIRASQWQASEAAAAATLQSTIALQAARETREAAERQWQPRVIAHPWFWVIPGDREGTQGGAVVDGTLHAAYYLVNQGSGPAFNVDME